MRSTLAMALLGLGACVTAARQTPPPDDQPRLDLWVDGSAEGPGLGTRASPFRALEGALEQGRSGPATVHLATGLYAGPFELPPGVRLEGGKAVVLHAEGAAVLHAAGAASLDGLMVQGAGVGLVAGGDVQLTRVKFSGQREMAIRLEAGRLSARDCELAASLSRTRGLVAGAGTRASLVGCTFVGPFARGLEAAEAEVEVRGGRFEGPVVGLHQVGGTARVESTVFSGGRGPAMFSAAGGLVLRGVAVLGHEYGLQTSRGARVDVADFESIRAERAALALEDTTGRLSGVVAVESGPLGAVQALGSDLTVERLRIHGPLASGILVRKGRLVLADATLTDVRGELGRQGDDTGGDGVVVREAELRAEGLTVVGASGLGLVATAGARVRLAAGLFEGCRQGGIAVDEGAEVEATSVLVRRTAAAGAVVSGGAVLRADLLTVLQAAGGTVWADCGHGARVLLSRTVVEPRGAGAPCISPWTR